jgi:hypothetical protein
MLSNCVRLSLCLLLGFLAWLLPGSPASARAGDLTDTAAADGYQYTLGGRVRLLLVWVGRDDVGVGRFVRREHHDGRTVELLVGMDPERAPRGVNRWGFSRESLRGGETEVVVAGTDYEAESLDDIQERLEREVSIAVGVLRARITPDAAVVQTAALVADVGTTYRDVASVLTRVGEEPLTWRTRRVARPDGVRSGFLMSLVEWIDRSLEAYRRDPASVTALTGDSIPYIYSDRIYDMALRRLAFEREAQIRGRSYPNVLRAEFETRNRQNGERNRFRVSYGTEGALAGVPVQIVLRPRWWLEAELLLDR